MIFHYSIGLSGRVIKFGGDCLFEISKAALIFVSSELPSCDQLFDSRFQKPVSLPSGVL